MRILFKNFKKKLTVHHEVNIHLRENSFKAHLKEKRQQISYKLKSYGNYRKFI